MRWPSFVITVLFCLGLTACLGAIPSPSPLPGSTASPIPETATPTIDWFPPTPTSTPLSGVSYAVTPTVNIQPEYSTLLFTDEFTEPNQWTTGQTGSGRISLGPNELTLAINRTKGYLYSLRQGTNLTDFYLEITANPTLCRAGDEYGLLLRVSPGLDFYRFALTCYGQARVDRLYQGKASSPQGLTPNGAIPRGAPSQSTLAVLAQGKQLHFFVNGEYQFSVNDPTWSGGSLGVFARAAGDNAVTVNFRDLKVYQVNGE